jgi:AAHS family 4-hydroxybenzoate transporter-like MFS transporter
MPKDSVAVQTIIDEGPWTLPQKLAALLAAGAITLDGLDIQVLGFPAISRDWHLDKSSFALIFAISLLAVAAGTFVGGFIGDKFGRRRAIVAAVLWFGVATILLATSKSLGMVFFWRMVSGLGIGAALPNATAFIAEITPERRRTSVISATIVCIPLGGVVGGLIAAHVLPVASWRILILIAGVLPVLLGGLLALVLPESPRFLATQRNGRDRLLKVLVKFGRPVGSDIEFLPDTTVVQSEGIAALVRPPFRRDTFSLWAAFCFCLVSIYFVFNWLPSMLSTLGLGPAAASSGLAAYNFGGVVGSILLGIWMNRIGSRIPLLIATVGSVSSAAWLALHLVTPHAGTPLLTFQLGLHGCFANAVQTSLYALAAHVYPTRLRSRGVAAASAFGRTGAILSAFLGGNALHHSGSTYFLILCVTLTGVTISLLFLRNHIPGQHAQAA